MWRLSGPRSGWWAHAALCAGVWATAPVHAEDASVSRDAAVRSARLLAAACTGCHGTDGQASDGMPSLAGYPRERMVATMQAFRAGQQPATVMHQLAQGFSDEQVGLLAEHFARQPTAR